MTIMDIIPNFFDNYFIKIIFLAHTFLLALVNISNITLESLFVYTSYNTIFLICLLLAVLVDKNTDIILIACALDVIFFGVDIVFLLSSAQAGLFATLVIIFNVVCRPFSAILLLKNYSARAGVEDPTSGLLEVHVQSPPVPRARSAYQNIDEPNQTLP